MIAKGGNPLAHREEVAMGIEDDRLDGIELFLSLLEDFSKSSQVKRPPIPQMATAVAFGERSSSPLLNEQRTRFVQPASSTLRFILR